MCNFDDMHVQRGVGKAYIVSTEHWTRARSEVPEGVAIRHVYHGTSRAIVRSARRYPEKYVLDELWRIMKHAVFCPDTVREVEELSREVASKRPVAAVLPANAPMAAAPKA